MGHITEKVAMFWVGIVWIIAGTSIHFGLDVGLIATGICLVLVTTKNVFVGL